MLCRDFLGGDPTVAAWAAVLDVDRKFAVCFTYFQFAVCTSHQR